MFEIDLTDYEPLYLNNKYKINTTKGTIINPQNKLIGYINYGYKYVTINKSCFCFHRVIWQQKNGEIPEGYVIDHIDDNPLNNTLENLQSVTPSENNKKSVKNRNYDFLKNCMKNKKRIQATNITTNEITSYNSMYETSKALKINSGIIKMVADNKPDFRIKHGISKINNEKYSFIYL